ncbi:MAG: FHA domain-containing protein, partial [Gammaproteobacteria bacterium SHHR-1]
QDHSYALFAGINRLGFLPDNDIVIDEDTVGRTHATIHYQGDGKPLLTDLNSLNGTRVNGERIDKPQVLNNGDRLALGNWQAVFHQRLGSK